MDLEAAAEGVALAHLAGLFVPSLICSLLCALLVFMGWVCHVRMLLIASLVVLLANQVLLVVFGAWQAVFSWSDFNSFIVVYSIMSVGIGAAAVASLHLSKSWSWTWK